MINTNSLEEYVHSILKKEIKGSPFKRKEIYEIHEIISQSRGSPYKRESVRRKLWEFKKEGIIEEVDPFFDDSEDTVFVYKEFWEDSNPEQEKVFEVRNPTELIESLFKNWI